MAARGCDMSQVAKSVLSTDACGDETDAIRRRLTALPLAANPPSLALAFLRRIDINLLSCSWFLVLRPIEEVNPMKRHAARLICLFLILSFPASAAETSILGTWRLQSFVREVIATGQRNNEFGEKPDGYISYLPEGRMHAILTIDDRMWPGGPVPPNDRKIKIGTTIGYAGTYTMAGDKITHHIEFSSNQNWTGTEQVRFYKLDGDTLTITTAISRSPKDGQDARTVAVWKRVK